MTTATSDRPDFDALWDFSDPAATERAFRGVLAELPDDGDPAYRGELLTQIARTQGLQRAFEDAHATLADVEPTVVPNTRLAARYELERGRALRSGGDPGAAEPHFFAAAAHAEGAGEAGLHVDALHMIAIVHSGTPEGIDWNLRALEVAEAADDDAAQRWRGALYNNLGWDLFEAGRHLEALDLWERGLAFRTERGQTGPPIWIARWTIARAWRELGRCDEALPELRAIEAERRTAEAPDGYVHEEVAECLLLLGRAREAAPEFARAHALLSTDAWLSENEPDRLERLRALGGGGASD